MHSNDRSFLEKKIDVLNEYTKRIDPCVPIPSTEVFEHPLEKQKQLGFRYYIPLHTRLPRVVRAFWQTPNTFWGCCRRASAIAAGILPAPVDGMVLSMWDDDSLPLAKKATSIIWSGSLIPGDMIYTPSHSFVYLDSDICLSKNGYPCHLEIQTVEAIRKQYLPNLPQNFLSQDLDCLTKHDITVYRKKEDFFYPDEIVEQIIKICLLWQLKKRPEKSEDRLKALAHELQTRMRHWQEKPDVSPHLKDSLTKIYDYFIRYIL